MSSSGGRLPAGQAGHAGGAGMARQDGRVRLQLRWHHGEAGLAHGGGGGARNEGRLGLDARQPGRGGPGALLLLDAVVLNQLGMLLLLLPDLQRPMKAPSFTRTSNCRRQAATPAQGHTGRLHGRRILQRQTYFAWAMDKITGTWTGKHYLETTNIFNNRMFVKSPVKLLYI